MFDRLFCFVVGSRCSVLPQHGFVFSFVWWAGKNGRTHATTTKCIEDGWHDLMNLYVGHCMIRVIKCGQHVFGVMVGSVASYGAVHRLTHHGRQGKAKMNHGKADND